VCGLAGTLIVLLAVWGGCLSFHWYVVSSKEHFWLSALRRTGEWSSGKVCGSQLGMVSFEGI
jgi:hypothetical protein